jgi:uncharacterized membrane protein
MNKAIGYVLIVVGFLVFLLSFPQVSKVVKIPMPAGVTANIIMIVGVAVLLVGAFLVSRGAKNKVDEVPVYSGKDVVAFRRIKK